MVIKDHITMSYNLTSEMEMFGRQLSALNFHNVSNSTDYKSSDLGLGCP